MADTTKITFEGCDLSERATAILDRIFNGPPRRVFTFTYRDPVNSGLTHTIDSNSVDAATALKDLRRWIGRQNAKLRRYKLPLIPLPRAYDICDELTRAQARQQALALTAPKAA